MLYPARIKSMFVGCGSICSCGFDTRDWRLWGQTMQPIQTMQPMQGQNMMQFQPYGNQINMGPSPTVYSSQPVQPAQMYTSGVPGAPPTIAIPTDDLTMQQFASPMQGPRPQRGITLKRRPNQPAGQPAQLPDSNTRINVIKGS